VQEPSIQNVVWSNRLHSNPMPIAETVEKTYFNEGNVAHGQEEYGKYPYIVGLHNGTGFGQDQTEPYLQRKQLKPYPHPHGPFVNNHMDQLVPTPTMYVNELASTGGAPLSIALDDPITLEHFMDSESRREAPENPFSAAYAKRAIEKLEWDPTLGSQRDAIRRNLKADEEDLDTTGRKIAAGFYSDPQKFAHVKTDLEPEIENFINRTRAPTRHDFDTLADKMSKPVEITHDKGRQLREGMRNSLFSTPRNTDNSLISGSSYPVLDRIYNKAPSPFTMSNRIPPLSAIKQNISDISGNADRFRGRRRSSALTRISRSGGFGDASLPLGTMRRTATLGEEEYKDQNEPTPNLSPIPGARRTRSGRISTVPARFR